MANSKSGNQSRAKNSKSGSSNGRIPENISLKTILLKAREKSNNEKKNAKKPKTVTFKIDKEYEEACRSNSSQVENRRTNFGRRRGRRGSRRRYAARKKEVLRRIPEVIPEEYEGQSQDENDPNKPWCICRQPHGDRFMIQCGKCQEWFHGDCVFITKEESTELENVEWLCKTCLIEDDDDACRILQFEDMELRPPDVIPVKLKYPTLPEGTVKYFRWFTDRYDLEICHDITSTKESFQSVLEGSLREEHFKKAYKQITEEYEKIIYEK